jgi:hypothetical protein
MMARLRFVFLTHSGADRHAAVTLSQGLESAFAGEVLVFCTSRPEYRIGSGEAERGQLNPDLIEYELVKALSDSDLHVVLATPNAVLRGNNWISYELQLAEHMKVAPLLVVAAEGPVVTWDGEPRDASTAPHDLGEVIERVRWLVSGETPVVRLVDGGSDVVAAMADMLALTPSEPEMSIVRSDFWRQ